MAVYPSQILRNVCCSPGDGQSRAGDFTRGWVSGARNSLCRPRHSGPVLRFTIRHLAERYTTETRYARSDERPGGHRETRYARSDQWPGGHRETRYARSDERPGGHRETRYARSDRAYRARAAHPRSVPPLGSLAPWAAFRWAVVAFCRPSLRGGRPCACAPSAGSLRSTRRPKNGGNLRRTQPPSPSGAFY